jgi:hypothetical protein
MAHAGEAVAGLAQATAAGVNQPPEAEHGAEGDGEDHEQAFHWDYPPKSS